MEATHYHNTDRAFDLPLLSKNFNAMEMKRTRVSTLNRSRLAEEIFIPESVFSGIMTSVKLFPIYNETIHKNRNGLCNGSMEENGVVILLRMLLREITSKVRNLLQWMSRVLMELRLHK